MNPEDVVKTGPGVVKMRLAAAAFTLGLAGGLGLAWVGHNSQPTRDADSIAPDANPVQCGGIMYADGADYVDEMTKGELIRAPKEVRMGDDGSMLMIGLRSDRCAEWLDLRSNATHSTPVPANEHLDDYTGLAVVSDRAKIAEALRVCITENPWPL